MDIAQNKRPRRGDLRSLLSTRQGTIAVAGISALVAAAILVYAMHQYRTSVDAKGKPETVLVANQLIQKGTSGSAISAERLFTPTRIVAKQASVGAVADASVLQGKVAVADIYPGQQLTASEFAIGGGLATALAANQRAVSIPMDASHGLIGQVTAGDHVDVYAGWYSGGAGRAVGFLRLLIPDVPVLEVAATGSTGTGGGGSSNAVLEVTDKQAGELAYASDNSKLWFTLRPPNATAPPASEITVNSLLAETPVPPVAGSGK